MRWPPTEDDKADVARLNAKPWQIELLSLNPDFTLWGPGEDRDDDVVENNANWNATLFFSTWAKFAEEFKKVPDDRNEIVHFYFELLRDSEDCEACAATGLAPGAKVLEDAFYNDTRWYQRWCDKITIDEAQALMGCNRLMPFTNGKPTVVDAAFVERVNQANAPRTAPFLADHKGFFLAHDAISRGVLIEARCKRQGIRAFCATCDGHGEVFTAKAAHVRLVLWMLHSGRSASRFVVIERLKQTERAAALALLKRAAERNSARFARLAKIADR